MGVRKFRVMTFTIELYTTGDDPGQQGGSRVLYSNQGHRKFIEYFQREISIVKR